MLEINSEAARRRLPELLDRAHDGEVSLIKKRGVPYAALVPIDQHRVARTGVNLLTLRGTGKGLWGADVAAAINEARQEWD